MDYIQKKFFYDDKSRNRTNKYTIVFLWAYRTLCSKGCFFSKKIGKIINMFFKSWGVEIKTFNIGGGLECRI